MRQQPETPETAAARIVREYFAARKEPPKAADVEKIVSRFLTGAAGPPRPRPDELALIVSALTA